MRVQLCVVEVGKDKPLQVRSRQRRQRFCSMQRVIRAAAQIVTNAKVDARRRDSLLLPPLPLLLLLATACHTSPVAARVTMCTPGHSGHARCCCQ